MDRGFKVLYAGVFFLITHAHASGDLPQGFGPLVRCHQEFAKLDPALMRRASGMTCDVPGAICFQDANHIRYIVTNSGVQVVPSGMPRRSSCPEDVPGRTGCAYFKDASGTLLYYSESEYDDDGDPAYYKDRLLGLVKNQEKNPVFASSADAAGLLQAIPLTLEWDTRRLLESVLCKWIHSTYVEFKDVKIGPADLNPLDKGESQMLAQCADMAKTLKAQKDRWYDIPAKDRPEHEKLEKLLEKQRENFGCGAVELRAKILKFRPVVSSCWEGISKNSVLTGTESFRCPDGDHFEADYTTNDLKRLKDKLDAVEARPRGRIF